MECPQCFSVGEHKCVRPYSLSARFHCKVCSGLNNPILDNGRCLWCFGECLGEEHIQSCPYRPVNTHIYKENKCYCSTIGVGVEELLKEHQEWKSVSVNCSMLEWEMYKQKCKNRKLYQNKVIWCMDGICLE